MADRQNFVDIRTDRPAGPALLTVADVLEMPSVRDGAPEVLVGGTALSAAVHGVHASDSAGVARLLEGGELLLTTAAGWPDDGRALRTLIGELADADLAGLVFELGARHPQVPDAVVAACHGRGLALVALSVEVKFVAVTAAVHRKLIAAQTDALHERQRLHELFTALSLRGVPADVVVRETARALGAPVVLENSARDVVAVEGLRMPVSDVLAEWRASSDGFESVAVQARETRWGTLSALDGPPHAAGRRTVLEQGATALAFGCLADGGDAPWTWLAQRGLIEDLLGARFATPDEIATRLEATGLPLEGRRSVGAVVHSGAVVHGGAVGQGGAVMQGTDDPARVVERARRQGLAALAAAIDGAVVVLLAFDSDAEPDDQALAEVAGDDGTIFVGTVGAGVGPLLASVRAARDLAARDSAAGGSAARDRGATGSRVRRVDARPLERLVAALRDDDRLRAHSERMLAPLIRYDAERRGDLLAVLGALVAHPGNRSAAATASHLSRSVFYQRLTLIGDLLEADLDDGETLAALHLALLAQPRNTSVPR